MMLGVEDNLEPGQVRFGDDDEVEVFDGQRWRPYRELPPDDLYTLFRNDPRLPDRGLKPEDGAGSDVG